MSPARLGLRVVGFRRNPTARRPWRLLVRAVVVLLVVGLGPGAVVAPGVATSAESDRSVLFVGDSNALSIYASVKDDPGRRWSVSIATRFGCGVVPYAAVVEGVVLRPTQPLCGEWSRGRGREIAVQPTSVAVLFIGGWEQYDRWVKGKVVRYSSAEWMRRTTRDYVRVLWEMHRSAPSVAVVLNGCHAAPDVDLPVEVLYQWGRYAPVINDPERIAATNEAARRAARSVSFPVQILDLHRFLCRKGYTDEMRGVKLRTDGLHFTQDGSRLIWSWMKQALDT